MSDMFSTFVYALLPFYPFGNIWCVEVHPSGHEDPPWFMGCVNASDSSSLRLYTPMGAHDLDPATCSARCLDEGYEVAALTSDGCYCGNLQLPGLIFSECFNKSSNRQSKDVRGGSERESDLYLPVGGGRETVGLYRTEGPFLRSIRLSTSPDRVQAGKTFVVEVSGNLAGRPNHPTGILSLAGQNFSYITVEFLDTTLKSQSSHHVKVLDNGSFVVKSEWILETPGKYKINISVSNTISRLSSTLHLSVSQPSLDGLVICVLPGPLGVPSCIPFQHTDSRDMTMQAAFLGNPVTLQAYLSEGLATRFCWCFTQERKEENKDTKEERTCVKTVCLPNHGCLNTSLDWMFEKEGVHTVSVNASNSDGWTQETIHIVVVHRAVSDLTLRVPGNPMAAGERISVNVELFTTFKHQLFLNLTLNPYYNHNYENSNLSSKDNDVKKCSDGIIDKKDNLHNENTIRAEIHVRKMTHCENSSDHCHNYRNHGKMINDHHLNGHHNNISLLHTSHLSGCNVHLYLHCNLPTTAGEYLLELSVFSTTDLSSVLLSTVLPQSLVVYEPIYALGPSGSWMSVVPTHAEFSLEVVSHARRMGSRVIWTFGLDNAVVMNRTSEEWKISLSLPKAGCYNVLVKAFNPVSSASFQRTILVQDPVGELVLNSPSVITTNNKESLLFSIAAGSNVTVSVLVNATLMYRNSSYATGEEAKVVLLFNHTGTVVVELQADNQVSSQHKSVTVFVEGNRKPSPQAKVNSNWRPPTSQTHVRNLADNVRIHAARQTYPTNTDVTFLAEAGVPDPVEFIWYFGDSTSARTSSRNITKRYSKPGRFDVVVVMTGGQIPVISEVFPLVVQRAVKLNRLIHQASVLQNQTVTVSCRVNVGTNLTFLWRFGDGSSSLGQSTKQHVFHRTGEFKVEVTVSNLVSSASLRSHIFVVDQPCQPPPVKNMGPQQLQVWRYEDIHLGVTYENEIDCDISGGLNYTWALFDSAGRAFPLPLTDTHRQSLILKSHLLHYDTYTATAKVQVIGSVVYSNYSVKVKVIPSPPVAFIQGGTNVFINNRNTTLVTLDGQRSYNPDFPLNPLSYSWTCKPVSSVISSCFNQNIPTSTPAVMFPASFLKHTFDQFQFTLTVYSGEHSASSEAFLSVVPNVLGKVSVYCRQCQGEQVNWDQSFSVRALCEDCDVSPEQIQYTWHLYLVNASSRTVKEVPFCHTVDLSAPSTVIKGSDTSPQTPGASSFPEITSKTRARRQNLYVTESGTSLNRSRNGPNRAGLALTVSTPATAGSGEEPFHPYLGAFDPPDYHTSTEYPPLDLDSGGILHTDHFWPTDYDSSADGEFSFPVLESGDIVGRLGEGDPGISAGRPTGVDDELASLGGDSVLDPAVHENEGSNLVDTRPSVVIQEPTLLDLPREPVDRGLFESYTYTGISTPLLSFRPFSLRPGSRYMLEVIAKSQNSFLGRTQLFVKTKPAPKGVTCQVQPFSGMELHTHFSIFCTSGKQDLVYKYSFGVGGRPPRILYQGRDFQYYFRLPSGDPSDDYEVTIYTEIKSSRYGTVTKPCPVTVRVQPSFFRDSHSSHSDRDPELSESGLRNLSALVRLGSIMEIRNYISVLSSILKRLSLDTEANTHAQRHIRNVLICTVCELENSDQQSLVDNLYILTDLLQPASQVSLVSARQVTGHIQAISNQFLESSSPVGYHLDKKTLNTLITLLSHILQAVVTSHDFTVETCHNVFITQALETASHTGEYSGNTINLSDGYIPDSSSGVHTKMGGLISKKHLAGDLLQIASDLMLKYILFNEAQEYKVSTGLIILYATYQNQNSTIISSGSTTFYVPVSMIQQVFYHSNGEIRQHQPCVFSVLTEITHSPYIWAIFPTKLSGPVVDLSLYKCLTRRKIPVRSLIRPISIELKAPQRNNSSLHEYVLLSNQVNYHSFNISQEHLQQSIQLSVVFMPPSSKMFPIMLLFRMFDRPTPSMHHLHRIHRWESNTTSITLSPSDVSATGVGHLALMNAAKLSRQKNLGEEISYSLTVDSIQCLSWDDHQGAWTHHGCRTQQTDTKTTVNCSCHQLKPVTVVRHQIRDSHDTTDLDSFISVSSDLTVLSVLVLCVCLYILGLVVCKRADVISEQNRKVHHLSDNSPFHPYLYAATIHTGLCSAAYMSAKVYIVLYGEDGRSQTRELQVPGCTLFRRNSKDTFILSAADSLGCVRGVHIWHDNSGPSPNWYLKQVEVSELVQVNGRHVKGRAWLFVGQSWLDVNKGDGRVERMLHICTQGIGFAKMLCLKLSDYLGDFHIWISVYGCPCPNSFTRTQRLSVCLLLLLGYACANTVIISRLIGDQLPFELGIVHISAAAVMSGIISVVAVLPAATVISFLFRLHEAKLIGPEAQHERDRETEMDYSEDNLSVNDSIFESRLPWTRLQQWEQEAWRKKYQGTDLPSVSNIILENKDPNKDPVILMKPDVTTSKEDAGTVGIGMEPVFRNLFMITEEKNADQPPQRKEYALLHENSKRRFRPISQWCHCLGWALCLLLSVSCLVLSAVLGIRFSSSQVLLWIQSFFFSLISCIFFIQPLVILVVAVTVSLWYKNRPDFHSFSSITEFDIETSKLWNHNSADQTEEQLRSSAFPQERCSHLEKLLKARQRARYLRFVRPPTLAELRKTRGRKRRETVMHKTLRDLSFCISMLFLVLCITYNSSISDYYDLNEAIRKQFISGNHDNAFMSIQKHEDWWKWTQSSLLDLLYRNASDKTKESQLLYILIGEPVLWKISISHSFQDQISQAYSVTAVSEYLRLLLGSRASTYPQSSVRSPTTKMCGHPGCHSATVGLGHTKSDAAFRLKHLHSSGWLGGQTTGLVLQFTLYSPAPNLFTSITLLTEQSPTGALLSSFKVQSARVYHTPVVRDYVTMMCQLLLLLLSLMQFCHQVYNAGQQGLVLYCRKPSNWLQVALMTGILVYYVYFIYKSIVTMGIVDVLQRKSYRGHVDVSFLATWEQYIRTIHGVMLFLLTTKCLIVLRVSRTWAASTTLFTRSLSSLFWPMISGFILLVALSCMGNLLFIQNSWAFSSIPRSFKMLLFNHWGLRAVTGLLFPGHNILYCGLYLSSTVVWTAMVMSVVSSIVKSAKRSQSRRNVFSVAALIGYIRQKIIDVPRQQRPSCVVYEERKTYPLEEFESLVDELLLKLDALSNSLHQTPANSEVQSHMEEENPVTSPTQEVPDMDTQDFVTQMTQETIVNRDVRVHREALPTSHLLRSRLELEILQLLLKRHQRKYNPASDIVVAQDNLQQLGKGHKETPNEHKLHTSLTRQNLLDIPESTLPVRVWTGEVLEEQVQGWTKTNNSCWLSKSQPTHTEVVVKALVHEEPRSAGPDQQ